MCQPEPVSYLPEAVVGSDTRARRCSGPTPALFASFRVVPCFLLALGLWWPFPKAAAMRAFQLNGYAQGTTYAITYYAADSTVTT